MENLSAKTVAKAWTFESSSGSNTYQTLQYTDGYTSCNCFGWTRREAPDGSRNCRHTRSVDMGTADTECLAMKDYTVNKAATQSVQTAKPKKKAAPKKLKIKEEAPAAIVRKISW